MRRKMPFTFFKYLFVTERFNFFLNMQISQVMTSYTKPNLIKYEENRYLSQFVSEMFEFLQ